MDNLWLYAVLLGLALLLASRFLPKRDAGREIGSAVRQLEGVMNEFASGIEEENKELIQMITDMRRRQEEERAALLERIAAAEAKAGEAWLRADQLAAELRELKRLAPAAGAGSSGSETENSGDGSPGTAPAPGIRERYAEILSLHARGGSVEGIARKLAMDKGEVQLILHLADREARAHA